MALTIQSYKTVAILLVASLLIIAIAVKSTNSNQSCQTLQPSIQIIDESGGKRLSGTSVATLEDSPFKNYVTAISQHVSAKINEMAPCHEDGKNDPDVELFSFTVPWLHWRSRPAKHRST